MKKLPYGISNYEELVQDNYYYVDKTEYIEKLESLAEKRILFLRPRKFGKTLFTSVLENYYDIHKKEEFEKLYGNTYIGKNPTKLRNSYHILRFNFSGIDTETQETTMKGFKEKIEIAIQGFARNYGIDLLMEPGQTVEGMLKKLFEEFRFQKKNEKIYVIIDEYDHFANELLGFHTEQFKNLVLKNGKIRKWYEILKEGTETVVERIFITGVAPITLDSLTSGFNIGSDITQDEEFNEMMGFTKEEVITLMKEQEIEEEKMAEILPILKENYNGYRFSVYGREKVYNSNMSLYFLKDYIRLKRIPEKLVDVNIASDYSKLGKMLELCQGERREEILEKVVSGEGIVSEITEKFNPAMEFDEKDMVSMLYYLGYLTITGEEAGFPKLKIPNQVMKEIYSEYFLSIVKSQWQVTVDSNYTEIARQIAMEGKIEKITEMLQNYLTHLSNRDYRKFDEKYVKLIFYCIAMNLKIYQVKSEMEVQRKYPDIVLIPKNKEKGYQAVMIEFKYLKKGEEKKIEEKKKEAREQIEEYGKIDDIKEIERLNKYIVIAVNDQVYVEKVK